MSYASVTAAQRAAVVRAAQRVITSAHRATQDYRTVNPVADPHVVNGAYVQIDTLLAQLKSAVDVTTAAGAAALVVQGDTVPVQNSAGTAVPGTSTANVAAGAVTNVRLAATNAVVSNTVKVNAGTVTGTGNFATFTVANGVITGITLSAS